MSRRIYKKTGKIYNFCRRVRFHRFYKRKIPTFAVEKVLKEIEPLYFLSDM